MKKLTVLFFIPLLLLCLCACSNNGANGKQAPTPALASDPLSTEDFIESGSLSAEDFFESGALSAEDFFESGSLSAEDFVESTRLRDENYAAVLKTRSVSLNTLTIHIADNLFDEESAPALAEKIYADYAALFHSGEGLAGPAEVYVLSLTTSGAPVMAGGELFCTLDQVENGDYLPYLVGTVFGCPSWWQCVGISRMMYGPEPDNDLAASLTSHFEQGSDIYLLSLFPSYFVEDFAGAKTRALAAQTAQSLTEYIISETDMETFLADGNDNAYRTAWLKSIGLPAETGYLESTAARYVSEMPFSSDKDFSLILAGDKITHYLQKTDWLISADYAYQFMVDFYEELEQLYARLEADAPERYSALLSESDNHFYMKIYDSSYSNSSRAKNDNVAMVLDWGSALHEIIHLIIPISIKGDISMWLNEGLATYLSAPYVSYWPDSRDMESRRVDSLATNVNVARMSNIQLRFKADLAEAFEKLNGCDISEIYGMDHISLRMYQAVGYAQLRNPGSYYSVYPFVPVAEAIGVQSDYPGNQLSYYESMLFVDYLTQQYGLDAVIKADMDMQAYYELFPDKEAFNEEFDQFVSELP